MRTALQAECTELYSTIMDNISKRQNYYIVYTHDEGCIPGLSPDENSTKYSSIGRIFWFPEGDDHYEWNSFTDEFMRYVCSMNLGSNSRTRLKWILHRKEMDDIVVKADRRIFIFPPDGQYPDWDECLYRTMVAADTGNGAFYESGRHTRWCAYTDLMKGIVHQLNVIGVDMKLVMNISYPFSFVLE
jgi:hypothetical protein